MTMLIYIVAQVNCGLLVMFDTLLKILLYYCWFQKYYFIFCHAFCMLLQRIDVPIFKMIYTHNIQEKWSITTEKIVAITTKSLQ